jgi:hypothetical protein
MNRADQYQKLFAEFYRIEREMRDAPQDGQQRELQSAARRIVAFEVETELPKLKQLVEDHGAAVAAIEQAKQKLARLETSIASQREYITGKFPSADTTADAIDCLAWELSARLGAQAVERLTAKAVELEKELRSFLKERKGLSDCLIVQQLHGWDKVTRESFAWLQREIAQAASADAQQQAA